MEFKLPEMREKVSRENKEEKNVKISSPRTND